ncbi:MAG TPA: hypothetical protein VHE35_37655 [Kofleriaceae bacterium]|nr:hypothetical protein [Kofleriaceae bacterium]
MRTLLAALALTIAGGCGGDDGGPTGPLDPDQAPVVAVDRFSDAAATLFRRSADPSLPAANAPIDLDLPPFAVHALGPAGEAVVYYSLDVRPRALVPVYELHRAGEAMPVPGQLNIFDYAPGDHGYNDLWRVIQVEVPAGYVANTVTDTAEINAAHYPLTPTTKIVNCPMVPAGSTAQARLGTEGTALRRGWYHDQVVYYFTFEEAPLAAGADGAPTSSMYVAYAVDPGQPGGGPPSGFRTEAGGTRTHNVVAAYPDDPAYAPLREVHVYDNTAFDSVHDLPTAMAAPAITTDPMLVNTPLVQLAR